MTTPSDTPRTDALVRFEFGPTGQPFPAHALLAMMQLARELERDLAALREQLASLKAELESANRAYADVMRAAAALCEARFDWILDEPDMSYEADGARMCVNDILAEADK
jgi:uncharacterized protein HemX